MTTYRASNEKSAAHKTAPSDPLGPSTFWGAAAVFGALAVCLLGSKTAPSPDGAAALLGLGAVAAGAAVVVSTTKSN
jgi:hypothetical protein